MRALIFALVVAGCDVASTQQHEPTSEDTDAGYSDPGYQIDIDQNVFRRRVEEVSAISDAMGKKRYGLTGIEAYGMPKLPQVIVSFRKDNVRRTMQAVIDTPDGMSARAVSLGDQGWTLVGFAALPPEFGKSQQVISVYEYPY